MSLVAVNGSQGFWERHEFAVADAPDLAAKARDLRAGRPLMVRRL